MKNFIIPIDFSDDSLKGLKLALLFSQKTSTNIQLVYVQRNIIELPASSADNEYKTATEKFEQIIKEYSPKVGEGSKLDYIIKKGKVWEEIASQAESFTESIISTSTHGASGFEEFFIGSNAFKIISISKRPVIAIRKGDVPSSISKIVMPIDITSDSRQKVDFTLEIASLFGAEIHLVGVTTMHSLKVHFRLKSYLSQISKVIAGKNIKFSTQMLTGKNPSEQLVNYANSVKADLISIVSERGNSVSDLILGNTTQELLNKSDIPVMTIPPREIHVQGGFRTQGG
jgi:nucleotide-binding universal stress UspA family protein